MAKQIFSPNNSILPKWIRGGKTPILDQFSRRVTMPVVGLSVCLSPPLDAVPFLRSLIGPDAHDQLGVKKMGRGGGPMRGLEMIV